MNNIPSNRIPFNFDLFWLNDEGMKFNHIAYNAPIWYCNAFRGFEFDDL